MKGEVMAPFETVEHAAWWGTLLGSLYASSSRRLPDRRDALGTWMQLKLLFASREAIQWFTVAFASQAAAELAAASVSVANVKSVVRQNERNYIARLLTAPGSCKEREEDARVACLEAIKWGFVDLAMKAARNRIWLQWEGQRWDPRSVLVRNRAAVSN